MPHKHNAARRHHIGKMKFKVPNWAEYGADLRRSDLANETTLMLGMVFGLRWRQSQGLVSSVLDLMGLDRPVPDHTTLSRRAGTWKSSSKSNGRQSVADGPVQILIDSTGLKIYGAGQWLEKTSGKVPTRLAQAAPGG